MSPKSFSDAVDELYWVRCELDLAEQAHRWKDVVELLARLTAAEPNQWRYHQRLGNALGWLGRYPEAASSFLQARKIGGSNVEKNLGWWIEEGLSMLASGDEKGYTKMCQEMLERVSEPRESGWSLTLLASGSSALTRGSPPVDRFLDQVFSDPAQRASCTGALLLIRSGRFEEGLSVLNHELQDSAMSWSGFGGSDELALDRADLPAFLAISHHRLGHQAEARRCLAEARSHLAQIHGQREWALDLAIKLVTREAESLVDRENNKLPDVPPDPFAH